MAKHRKYGTLELVRHEIRGMIKTSIKIDPVTHYGRAFREGLDAALKLVDRAEEDEWCMADLDADREIQNNLVVRAVRDLTHG
jgi:hypothetical protein